MDTARLLALALAAPPDTAERVLYAAAAFNALIDQEMVLVGGAAQLTHTGIGRPSNCIQFQFCGRMCAMGSSVQSDW